MLSSLNLEKVVFYFVAPARVDFRGLVKDLVSELKLRIELRQISVRDRAASQGALGPCGRELCCSSFLSRYGNVNIKMAKNQNLTLNYSKLNGVCGQLKCCLQYEDEVYDQKRKALPNEGRIIRTRDGEMGKVFRLHLLSEQFDLLTNKGKIKRYTAHYFDKEIDPKRANMPHKFDHLSDETTTVIGLTEEESRRSQEFEKSIKEIKAKTLVDIQEVFADLTGIAPNEQIKTSLHQEVEDLSKNKVEVEKEVESIDHKSEVKLSTREENSVSNDQDDKKSYKHKGHRNNHNRKNKQQKRHHRNKGKNKPQNNN
jgi:hypothetical protein